MDSMVKRSVRIERWRDFVWREEMWVSRMLVLAMLVGLWGSGKWLGFEVGEFGF